jgi:hypothetical protein
MKKRCIVLFAVAMLFSSGAAYAGDLASGDVTAVAGVEVTGTKTGGITSSIGKLSTNVKLGVSYNTQTYAFTTKHSNGSKKYGSSSGDTKLFYLDEDKTVDLEAPDASDSSAFTSWTVL